MKRSCWILLILLTIALACAIGCGGSGGGGSDDDDASPDDDDDDNDDASPDDDDDNDDDASPADDDDDASPTDDDDNDNDDNDDDNDTTETVWTDSTTGLMWQNGATVGSNIINWKDAVNYCLGLNWAGYTGWRMPDLDELRSLIRGCAYTETGGSCGWTDDCRDESCGSTACDGCSDYGGPAPGGAYWPSEVSGNIYVYWTLTPSSFDHDIFGVDFAAAWVGPFGIDDPGPVRCVRGPADDDDDDVWSPMINPAVANLIGIWGSSHSDVYAVGAAGTILHYDGSSWTAQNSNEYRTFYSVWVDTTDLHAWAAGEQSTIAEGIAGSWYGMPVSGGSNSKNFYGITGYSGLSSVTAVGSAGFVVNLNNGTFVPDNTIGTSETLYAVYAGYQQISTAGAAGTFKYYDQDLGSWQPFPSFPSTTEDFHGLLALDDADMAVVGTNGTVYWWDPNNTVWTKFVTNTSVTLNGVWKDPNAYNMIMVGAGGTILHWDGNTVQPMNSPVSFDLHGIWATGPTDVFVVGDFGTILHLD